MRIFYNLPVINILFLINEYIVNLNPLNIHYISVVQSGLLSVALKIIRIYSILEIYFNIAKRNTISLFDKILKSNSTLNVLINIFNSNKKLNDLDFVKDNKIEFSINVKDVLDSVNSDYNPIKKENFDFIIYSEVKVLKNNNKMLCKRIFKELPTTKQDFQCSPVDYKFILSEIIVGDRTILAKFSEEQHNFFVVGNEFDSKFIHYYLTTYHPTEIINLQEKEIKQFKLKVIDHNVEEKEFTSENILKIEI